MDNKVGTIAGQIWQHLHQNGPTTVTELKKEFKLKNVDNIHQGLGWLAREGKVESVQDKRYIKYSIK